VDIQRFPSAFTGTAIRCNRPGCSMLMGHAYILRLPVMVGKRPCNSSSIIFIKSDLCSSAATIGKINTLSFPFTTNLCGLFN
jgi:hypothetical protein